MCKKNGIALISVLLVTALLSLLTISMIAMSSNFLATFGNSEQNNKALNAAESGIEYAIYKLNQDPNWGVTNLEFGSDDSSPVTFDKDTSVKVEHTLEDTKFTITFDTSEGASHQSENNLFSDSPSGDTPPYTAKIISIGESGHSKKVLKAYLSRSDFYPYAINADSPIIFKQGAFSIQGDSTNDNRGNIYSAWKVDPNQANAKSIQAYAGVSEISCNNGLVIGKGPVDVGNVLKDGIKKENCATNMDMNKIDVKSILQNAKANNYGTVDTIMPGKVTIKEEPPPPPNPPPTPTDAEEAAVKGSLMFHLDSGDIVKTSGPLYSILKAESGGTGFSTPDVAEFDPDRRGVLVLKKDIFVTGSVPPSDRNLPLYDDFRADRSNVFRIYRDESADLFKTYEYTYTYTYTRYDSLIDGDGDANTPPTLQINYGETSASESGGEKEAEVNYVKLDLNGHTIYSDSHLILGVEVIGQGRLIADGKIACLFSNNSNEVICISNDDLCIELSNNFIDTSNKGFYYAGDDLSIKPMHTDSLLASGGTAASGVAEKVTMSFPPGFKFTDNETGDKIIVGNYNPNGGGGHGGGHGHGGGSDYTGIGINVSKPGDYIIVKGETSYSTTSSPIEFRYNDNTQISIPGSYFVKVVGSSIKLMDKFGTEVPLSNVPNLTSDILNLLGKLAAGEFSTGNALYYNMTVNATAVSLNQFSSLYSYNFDNICFLDTDSAEGRLNLIQNSGYMKNILNIERTNFKVRKVSCYEIE